MTAADNSQLKQFLEQLLDGSMSDGDLDALNRLLKSSPHARQRVVDFLLLDSLLQDEIGSQTMQAVVDMLGDPDLSREQLDEQEEVHQSSMAASDAASTRRPPGKPWSRLASWFVAAAGVALVTMLIAANSGSLAFADASNVVAAAADAHAEPVERIYAVRVEREKSAWMGFVPPKDVRVSTQGDRFWVAMNGSRRWAWGRDADGAIWLSLNGRRGMRIEPDEVGDPLDDIAQLYSLSLESLLETAVRDFELDENESVGSTHVITATPKRGRRRWIRKLIIAVDRETKVVKRLVIDRGSSRRGPSKMTFTLIDSRGADDAHYRLEGHLNGDYEVMTRETAPDRRRAVLTRVFGRHAERWITPEKGFADE